MVMAGICLQGDKTQVSSRVDFIAALLLHVMFGAVKVSAQTVACAQKVDFIEALLLHVTSGAVKVVVQTVACAQKQS